MNKIKTKHKIQNQRLIKSYLTIALVFTTAFLLSQISYGFLTLNETAELLPENYYKLGVAPQLLISDGGGLNVGAYVDTFLAEDMNGRITIGGGTTDFWTQASVKWVPFPDIDQQPAMGGRAAVIYARDEDLSLLGFQISPLFSKKADTQYGNMIPYAGLPITFFNTKDKSYVATQFTVGAEWFPEDDKHIGAEFNLNLSNSISSVSVYFGFPFEGQTGYKKN